MSAPLRWQWYRWAELSPDRLYAILRLRTEVFVVEQNCVFQDLDGRDPGCEHLVGMLDGERLTAYLRLVPPGPATPVALGRVVVAPAARGRGYGRAVMQEGLRRCADRHPDRPVKVSAQQHLERFYNSLGFDRVSEPYLEDGIWHIDMLRP